MSHHFLIKGDTMIQISFVQTLMWLPMCWTAGVRFSRGIGFSFFVYSTPTEYRG